MRNLTLAALLAAVLLMVACQDKPIEPMKPKVEVGMLLNTSIGAA